MAITKLAKADIDGDIVDYSGRKLATKQSVTDLSTSVATSLGNKADASALASKADSSALTTVSTALGTLASLTTAVKTSVVAAVNELVVSVSNRLRVDGVAQTISAPNQTAALTALGASAVGHKHSAADLTSGTVALDRAPARHQHSITLAEAKAAANRAAITTRQDIRILVVGGTALSDWPSPWLLEPSDTVIGDAWDLIPGA